MDGFDWACLTVGVLVPILCGVVTQHLGFGPLLGVIIGGGLLIVLTRVFRVR